MGHRVGLDALKMSNILPLPGIQLLLFSCTVHSLVTTSTVPSRFLCLNKGYNEQDYYFMNCRPSLSIHQACNARNWTSFRKLCWAENLKHWTTHKHVVSITKGLWQRNRKWLWPVPRRAINYSNCVAITKEPKHAVCRTSLIYIGSEC